MAEQVIIVPASDVAANIGGHTLVANTDYTLIAANPNRERIVIGANVADVWLAYGTSAAVVGEGTVVRAGSDPFVEGSWKGAIHVISTGAAVVGYTETALGTTTPLGEDTGFTPVGPDGQNDDYFETAVASTPNNVATAPYGKGGWRTDGSVPYPPQP